MMLFSNILNYCCTKILNKTNIPKRISISGNKDTDREILLLLSNEDLISISRLNKYFYYSVCDENFYKKRFFMKYPNAFNFKHFQDCNSYKSYYYRTLYKISKLQDIYDYYYIEGNLEIQYKIFKSVNFDLYKYSIFDEQIGIEAAKKGELPLIKAMERRLVNIHTSGEYILRCGCEKGYLDIVKYLVEDGADIHVFDNAPLRLAALDNHLEIVKYLVENGADVNNNIIRLISCKGDFEIVKYLGDLGVDIHIGNERPLKWACYNGNYKIVEYLVNKGADIHIDNDEPFRIACEEGHLKIVKYLISKGSNIDREAYYMKKKIRNYLNIISQ